MNPWQSKDYAEGYKSRHGKYPSGYNPDAQTGAEAEGDDQDIAEEWNRHRNGKAAAALHPIDPADFLLEPEAEPKVVESPKPERKAASQTLRQPVAETVARLVEESRDKRKRVTAKQYQQATKLQVGSEIFELGLTNTQLVIWFYLSKCSDLATKECFPSITDISKKCKCRRSTVIECIRTLEAKKIIRSVRQYRKSTTYIMCPPEDWSHLQIIS
jgi:DNA-binding MarR family transcriptional regulator